MIFVDIQLSVTMFQNIGTVVPKQKYSPFSYFVQNAMKVHLRTHTDILPYVCNYCHRRFREKGSVVRHKRVHTGEKPYECRHCGRCFAEHGTLNRHLKAKGQFYLQYFFEVEMGVGRGCKRGNHMNVDIGDAA